MKKAVIVIDMPKNCDECRFNYDMGYRCDALDEGAEHNTRDMYQEVRPCWCPLRPYEESIPIEWLERKLAEHWYVDYDIRELLEDWEKENE